MAQNQIRDLLERAIDKLPDAFREILIARLVEEMSVEDKEVRDFAENIVRDHTAVNDQALALVKKLNVTPQDNDTSRALVRQADAK
jgi:putative membrane protein